MGHQCYSLTREKVVNFIIVKEFAMKNLIVYICATLIYVSLACYCYYPNSARADIRQINEPLDRVLKSDNFSVVAGTIIEINTLPGYVYTETPFTFRINRVF